MGKNLLPDKYSPEPDRVAVYLDYGPMLPDSYHQDIIVALIRDPKCIFAYWELSDTAVKTALRNIIDLKLKWVLRTHNLDQQTSSDVFLATPPNYDNINGNYYLFVLSDTRYQLEIGIMTERNGFVSLLKSNIVTTPKKDKGLATGITSYS